MASTSGTAGPDYSGKTLKELTVLLEEQQRRVAETERARHEAMRTGKELLEQVQWASRAALLQVEQGSSSSSSSSEADDVWQEVERCLRLVPRVAEAYGEASELRERADALRQQVAELSLRVNREKELSALKAKWVYQDPLGYN